MGRRGVPKAGTKKSLRYPGPAQHPAYRRWMLDMDYVQSLGRDDQAWLLQFCDEHYAADFRWESPMHVTTAEKRERYVNQNRIGRDLMGRAAVGGWISSTEELHPPVRGSDGTVQYEPPTLDAYHPDQPGAPDVRPTPVYLGARDYQLALTEYRALVDEKPTTERQAATRESRLELLQSYLLSIAESDGGGDEEHDDDDPEV